MADFISATPREGHVCRIFESHDEGVFVDLDIEEYHSGPGVGSTQVKAMANSEKTPAHFYWEEVKGYKEQKEKAHFVFGRAQHCLIEDPSQKFFQEKFLVRPSEVIRVNHKTGIGKTMKCDGTTTEGKEFAAQAEAEGKSLIGDLAYKQALDSVNGLYRQNWFRRYIEHPDRILEASVYKKCPLTGLMQRVRPDLWIPGVVVLDYKGTADAGPDAFGRNIGNLKYHIQQALYLRVTGESTFKFAAMEKSFPYLSAEYDIDYATAARGVEMCDYALTLIAQCYESEEWPGFSGGTLEPPPFTLK